ncbi:MAG: ABC transporter ATP-binding protein [Chloroflexi bacterium]|nr:ABC transporter ATP-binding protein [Chloroflexota bacterium]
MKQTILRTEDLKAYYVLDLHGTQKVVKAVNEVNLEIRENEVYGIAGESGCGKTTLLKTLFGAIEPPLRLMGGRVLYRANGDELDIISLGSEERRRLRWEFISYVPQGSMSVLNPVLQLKESYQDFLASHASGKTKAEAVEIAKQHTIKLGLPRNILEAYPHQLSGGMRQRVTIALATILKPRVIICDEPTTALDVVVQRGVVQLLKDVQRNLENTIVIVTHDMGVQANIADRVGIMYAGKLVEEALTETIFAAPFHPYTRYLIDSLPRFGDKTTRGSVPGSPPSLSNLPSGCPFHPRCPYALNICAEQMPELVNLALSHKVACWLVGEGVYGKAA